MKQPETADQAKPVMRAPVAPPSSMRNKLVFLVAILTAFVCAFAAIVLRSDIFAGYVANSLAFAWLALLDDERVITIRWLLDRVARLEAQLGERSTPP